MMSDFDNWFDGEVKAGSLYEADKEVAEFTWQAAQSVAVPDGWMRDKFQVESLIAHLEGIAYQQTTDVDFECVNQAAAMSLDVLRLVILPMLPHHE